MEKHYTGGCLAGGFLRTNSMQMTYFLLFFRLWIQNHTILNQYTIE